MATGTVPNITLAEVKKHNTPEDLWIVIHDKVYNVTKFLHEHPGGEEVLIDAAGKDATKDFDEVGHSDSAIEQLAGYLVADIVDEERREKKSKSGDTNNCKYISLGISALMVAAGAAIIYKGYRLVKSNSL